MIAPTDSDLGRRVVLAVGKRPAGVLTAAPEAPARAWAQTDVPSRLGWVRFDYQKAGERPMLAPLSELEWAT